MTDRSQQLRKLMYDYNLTCADVGQLLDRTPITVRIWRCKNSQRQIPNTALIALKVRLRRGDFKRAVQPYAPA
jgi:hypothetical protein